MLYVIDIRDPSQLVDPAHAAYAAATDIHSTGRVNMSFVTSRCIFTHLDDTIVVGAFYFRAIFLCLNECTNARPLFLGGSNGHMNQYDLRSFDEPVNFSQTHSQGIHDLQLSHEQGLLITASADKTAQLYDASSLDLLKTYK